MRTIARPVTKRSGGRSTMGSTPRDWRLGGSAIPANAVAIAAGVALLALVWSLIVGTISVAVFLAAMGLVIVLEPRAAGADLVRFAPLLALPLLAVMSTLWSDAPASSMRAGLEVLITCAAAILICRRLSAPTFVLLLFPAFGLICALMLPDVPSAVASHAPLWSALLGSKNQVGFAGHMLLALSLAVAADRRQPLGARLATLPAGLLATLILVLAQSAGALTSAAVTLITLPAFVLFGRFNISLRVATIILALVLVAVALVFLSDIQAGWADFRLHVLKKDATLTGRTYLWSVAERLNAERPWLGRGYSAFWRQGNIDAEGLWRWGGIANRGGFNFHNAFVDMQVDLGWIGVGLFIVACAAIGAVGFFRQVLRPSVPIAFLLSMLIVNYARTYSETGLIAPFSVGTLLWIAMAVYALEPASGTQSENRAVPRMQRPGPRADLRDPRRV